MKSFCKDLPLIWVIVIIYQIVTIILISTFDLHYFSSFTFLFSRSVIILYLLFRYYANSPFIQKYPAFFDTMLIYMLLAFFYGETAHLNTFLFPKIDPYLVAWDEWIFGYQPSIRFSEMANHPIFSELMFLAYFSYYLMPFIAFVAIWVYKRTYFEKFSFLILSGYFTYYLLFICIPAAGPQFYFTPPLNQIETSGFFGMLVKLIQKYGEAPTAAFPSSHIGISVMLLILLFRNFKKLAVLFLPFCLLLIFSTVYIKAHYFVDILAGILTGPLILAFNQYIYSKYPLFYADRDTRS